MEPAPRADMDETGRDPDEAGRALSRAEWGARGDCAAALAAEERRRARSTSSSFHVGMSPLASAEARFSAFERTACRKPCALLGVAPPRGESERLWLAPARGEERTARMRGLVAPASHEEATGDPPWLLAQASHEDPTGDPP